MRWGRALSPVASVAAAFLVFGAAALGMTTPAQAATIISVVDYGADPSGALPSSGAIQSALDAASPGEEVLFPAGVYRIDSPLLLDTDDVSIQGAGRPTLKFDNGTDYFALYNHAYVGMLNICASHVNVDGLTIDQNFRSSGRHYGQDRPLIDGIIMGCQYLGGTAVRMSDVAITHTVAWDYYGNAIAYVNAPGISDLTITNNQFYSNFYVLGLTAPSHAPLVHGEQAISATSATNLTVKNNLVFDAMDDAIATHQFNVGVLIEDNWISSVGGRLLINGVTNGIVRRNTIVVTGDSGTGIFISFENGANRFSPNDTVEVYDNQVILRPGVPFDAAVALAGPGEHIDIHDNTLVSYIDPVQQTYRRSIGVTINQRFDNYLNAYYFGSDITIENNTVINFATGINEDYIPPSQTDVIIDGNRLINVATLTNPPNLQ